jgi:hypothetical protein
MGCGTDPAVAALLARGDRNSSGKTQALRCQVTIAGFIGLRRGISISLVVVALRGTVRMVGVVGRVVGIQDVAAVVVGRSAWGAAPTTATATTTSATARATPTTTTAAAVASTSAHAVLHRSVRRSDVPADAFVPRHRWAPREGTGSCRNEPARSLGRCMSSANEPSEPTSGCRWTW